MTVPDPNARSIADLLREIGDLRDEVIRLKNALNPFAELAQPYARFKSGQRVLAVSGRELFVDDLRTAADLLRV